jgi:Flp pilus assembly secretin CpaC
MKSEQKKSLKINSGLSYISLNNFFNYFFAAALGAVAASKWIANLGVVPLFLLSAFLLAPAFFAFLNLLFVVTHVLETIGKPLYNCDHVRPVSNNFLFYNLNLKPYFLPISSQCVKVFFSFLVLIPLLITANALAEDFILSRGQSMTIKLPKIEKFNVANKEILTYKMNEKEKSLFIRGAKIGVTEILIWEKGHDAPRSYQVFVVSKTREEKLMNLAQIVGDLGLETKIQVQNLKVSGELKNLKQYLQYKKIQGLNSEIILDESTLSIALKKDVLADVYQMLLNDYKDSVKCRVLYSDITCFISTNDAPSDSLKKHLAEKYKVNFVEQNNQKIKNNYSFKLKLIQLEQMDGEELRLGLDQLSTSLGDLITLPLNKIVEKNAVLLAQKKVQINTLAEPEALIRPMTPAEFQIGADIPYVTSNREGTYSQTQFQFAGLKVKVILENIEDKIKITYETELTKPSVDSKGVSSAISGNKEKSSVVINLNDPTKIFQISLKTEANGVDQMPFLNRIPLLGELFKSKSNQNNFKTITGIIEVKNHE